MRLPIDRPASQILRIAGRIIIVISSGCADDAVGFDEDDLAFRCDIFISLHRWSHVHFDLFHCHCLLVFVEILFVFCPLVWGYVQECRFIDVRSCYPCVAALIVSDEIGSIIQTYADFGREGWQNCIWNQIAIIVIALYVVFFSFCPLCFGLWCKAWICRIS